MKNHILGGHSTAVVGHMLHTRSWFSFESQVRDRICSRKPNPGVDETKVETGDLYDVSQRLQISVSSDWVRQLVTLYAELLMWKVRIVKRGRNSGTLHVPLMSNYLA